MLLKINLKQRMGDRQFRVTSGAQKVQEKSKENCTWQNNDQRLANLHAHEPAPPHRLLSARSENMKTKSIRSRAEFPAPDLNFKLEIRTKGENRNSKMETRKSPVAIRQSSIENRQFSDGPMRR